MTQYDDTVERQRLLIEAEDWARQIKSLHVHSLQSMHYDSRPEDTADGKSVTDREYNSGIIERFQDGKLIHTFGKKLKGQALINSYVRHN